MAILVTGAAGFIGHHVAKRLLDRSKQTIGADPLNHHCHLELKRARIREIRNKKNRSTFLQFDFTANIIFKTILENFSIDRAVYLDTQACVRHPNANPHAYISANLIGHLNILEFYRRRSEINRLVYTPSLSVYGSNTKSPVAAEGPVDIPISLHAAIIRL